MAVLARFLIVCWAVSVCCVIISVLNGIGIRDFLQRLETEVSWGAFEQFDWFRAAFRCLGRAC